MKDRYEPAYGLDFSRVTQESYVYYSSEFNDSSISMHLKISGLEWIRYIFHVVDDDHETICDKIIQFVVVTTAGEISNTEMQMLENEILNNPPRSPRDYDQADHKDLGFTMWTRGAFNVSLSEVDVYVGYGIPMAGA